MVGCFGRVIGYDGQGGSSAKIFRGTADDAVICRLSVDVEGADAQQVINEDGSIVGRTVSSAE